MTIVETLKAARARIAAGWTKHTYFRHWTGLRTGCSYCAIGAVHNLTSSDRDTRLALGVLMRSLPARDPDELVRFNDAPGTKKADILALYDRAIAHAQVVQA
jgi:hypothetical protein